MSCLPKSMTGYAKIERVLNEYRINCELKALNSRYLNVELSCPSFLSSYEIELTKLVQRYIKRGKVSLRLFVEFLAPPSQALHIDFGLAKLYYDGLEDLVTRLGIPEPVNLDHLLRFRELVRFELPREQEERLWEACKKVVEEALEKLDSERTREGKDLSEQLLKIVEDLSLTVESMRQSASEIRVVLKEKLSKNVEQLLGSNQIDPNLLENLVALNVQKLDVREEIDRLESHLKKAKELLVCNDAVGNHLDFLAQEMLREFNTVLSKSEDARLVELGLKGKLLVSQFREQLQNLE
ncbi:YicC/YloC family endoribonuclease [Pseudothermotoga sp.]|nr:YicC family protein [Pseudothermotoga sp.]MCX7813086.1 YicC family protein [Pseudothermotoga sp.]MDW8140488.1 YicC/YloC family endoribonuclease [Pseudothermotoga sp.]